MTPKPTPLATVLPCDREAAADLARHLHSGEAPKANARIRSGAVDHIAFVQAFARHRLAALEETQAEIIAAYKQGALDVHNHWQDDRDPDFTEAAHDYASSRTAIRALSNKTGKGSNS